MPKCKIRDYYELPSSRETTSQGFLKAPAKIARTGVQTYSRRELGLDGGDKPIRLYRPPEEVARSSASFESAPMADEHPPEEIVAGNWKQYAIGDVRDVTIDGDFLSACVIVRDEDAIALVRDGKAELSCGYSFELDMTPGTTPKGEQYDAVQRDIQGNHVAIVDRGRAGSRVRIADTKGTTMKTRITVADKKLTDKVVIPGLSFDLELDEAAIKTVQDKFDLHAHGIGAAKDAYDNLQSEHQALQKHAEKLQDALEELTGDDDDDVEMSEHEEPDADDDDDDDDAAAVKTGDKKPKGYTKDGKPSLKLRLRRALDKIARLTKENSPEAREKMAEERAKVIDAAKPFLGEKFDGKGKSVHEVRLAALDAAAKDKALEPIVQAQLGGRKVEKLTVADASRAFDTIVAVGGKRSTASDDDGQDTELSKKLAGFRPQAADVVYDPRQAWIDRETRGSRQRARGRDVNPDRDDGSSMVEDR